MGNAVSPGVSFTISPPFRRPTVENPTLANIRALQQTDGAERDAECVARVAEELLEQVQQRADRHRVQAQLRQEEADSAAVRAAEATARLKAQMEEAQRAARHAQGLALAASHTSREKTPGLARAREEYRRAQKMREEAEELMTAAKEEAENAQRAADTENREAEAAKALAHKMADTAEQEAQRAMKAEKCLGEDIQPVVVPSPTEVAAAKRRIQYKEDCFHFAVVGISGSGKSSLVNAFRGLRNQDEGAAAVGVMETTVSTTRYHDGNHPDNPYVWYDVPSAGTFKCRDWEYFNDLCLYVFDCIIVLLDNRFTETDLAILTNARRFRIPTYVVRSKADQHIRNLMMEMGYDSDGDEEEDIERRDKLYNVTRKQFVEGTRQRIQGNLDDAKLSDQRVYIVSSCWLLSLVTGKMPRKTIDELGLLIDLGNEAHARRKAKFMLFDKLVRESE